MEPQRRSPVVDFMVNLTKKLGLIQPLKRLPGIYGLVRRGYMAMIGHSATVRRISGGPLKGLLITLGHGDRNAYLLGDYDPKTADWVLRTCRPGMTVFDIGAHVGYFTLLMARCVGESGKVYTVEASPDNVSKIEMSLRANEMNSVTVISAAISGSDGKATFMMEPTGSMGHLVESDSAITDAANRLVTVSAVRLDTLVQRYHPSEVGFIKMDVEGAELQALAGMKATFDRLRPLVLCEWHPAQAGTDFAKAFADVGYNSRALGEVSATEPFQVIGFAPERANELGSN